MMHLLISIVSCCSGERLVFAHGGVADFRGVNDSFYDIFSAPGYGLAMRTNDVTYLLPIPKYVDGSMFTQAVWTVRGRSDRHYEILMDASDGAVFVLDKGGSDPSSRATRLLAFFASGRSGVQHWSPGDGVSALRNDSVVSVRGNGWETNVTRHRVRNFMSGVYRWKLTTTILPLVQGMRIGESHGYASRTCYPHGLVGQSFDGDGVSTSGRVDDYSSNDSSSVVTTRAMAEGAIEGVAEDYVVVRPFFVRSKRSRYGRRHDDVCSPRDALALSGGWRAMGVASSVLPGVESVASLFEKEEDGPLHR